MRVHNILLLVILATSATAGWFGGDKDASAVPEFSSWDGEKLASHLKEQGISVPHGFTRDELVALAKANYDAVNSWEKAHVEHAQKVFSDAKESLVDGWTESQLREFLLEQGIIAPASRSEQLRLLAKTRYKALSSAVSSYSAAFSTAIHGDATAQASKSLNSAAAAASRSATAAAAEASRNIQRAMDESKDFIWSEWSDSDLRNWLEEHRFVKTKAELKREELLEKMKHAYTTVYNPAYEAWSTSYIHEWLVANGVIKSDYQQARDKLLHLMKENYYSTQDKVYQAWSDSDLKVWLVEHEVIKSDAQIKREKLIKLMDDHYNHARDIIWSSWKDSDMHDWLIDRGYLRSEAQARRDELEGLMHEKYDQVQQYAAAYLTWPDARLRAYLRNNGVDDTKIPGMDRTTLLQETRIRWVQTTSALDDILATIRRYLMTGTEFAEDKVEDLKELLGLGKASLEREFKKEKKAAYDAASDTAKSASSAASKLSSVASSASAKSEL
ncbi:hypothetical protein DACRYDRAFT_117055 [Dacryopinax primogenitus]|uniref:Uncharacterized protein n=1 Tax=Dacryopinax primogenitus (strain DJM 731) TaxID=1858805 RepID=M5G3Z2_DACPD|nr:uncharacterized protein DACRYDRAFT_117055 [Dacryopinax primogenitus]EJU00562.1 hypothetical protein DACRYDRAFT_117055 [Dacryopinax primogenitus]